MSDAQRAEQDRDRLPRDSDGPDDPVARSTGVGDDRPTTDDGGDGPVRDRPAGPGAEGGQVSGAGEISPGPVGGEDVPEDDVVEERRQHVIANHGGDGTDPGRTAADADGRDGP